MKWLKLFFVGVSLVLALGRGALAQAAPTLQQSVAFATVQAQFWPEFDKPLMLVILDVTLAANTASGSEIAFRIPAASGGPLAVAEPGSAGKLVNLPYTANIVGDEIILTFKPAGAGFRVEYYDPHLTFDGAARTYTFAWPTDYAVGAFAVRVQQPAEATNFQITPALAAPTVGEYGLNYYDGSLGAVVAGQAATLQVRYSKPSTQLSADLLGTTADAAPAVAPAPPPLEPTNWALVLAAAAGGGLVGARLVWFAGRAKSQRTTPPRRATAPRARSHPTPQAAPAPRAFCPQCGQPRVAADSFCRQCGAQQ